MTVVTTTPLSLSILVGEFSIVTGSPLRTPYSAVSVHIGMGGLCCNQALLVHPRLCPGFRYARKIQPTLRIPTQMSSIGYPATT